LFASLNKSSRCRSYGCLPGGGGPPLPPGGGGGPRIPGGAIPGGGIPIPGGGGPRPIGICIPGGGIPIPGGGGPPRPIIGGIDIPGGGIPRPIMGGGIGIPGGILPGGGPLPIGTPYDTGGACTCGVPRPPGCIIWGAGPPIPRTAPLSPNGAAFIGAFIPLVGGKAIPLPAGIPLPGPAARSLMRVSSAGGGPSTDRETTHSPRTRTKPSGLFSSLSSPFAFPFPTSVLIFLQSSRCLEECSITVAQDEHVQEQQDAAIHQLPDEGDHPR